MKPAAGRWLTLGLLLALVTAPQDAAAYIDPGTGSLLLQGLIAGIAAGAVAIRGYWYRIKTLFRRKPEPEKPAPEPKRPSETE